MQGRMYPSARPVFFNQLTSGETLSGAHRPRRVGTPPAGVPGHEDTPADN